MTIQEAINYYKQAQKEATKAAQAAKEASESEHEFWKNIDYSMLKDKESPAVKAAQEASEKARKARQAENITTAVLKAAADNVLNVAVNRVRDAMQETPDKFNKPVHFKVFKENLKQITGENFYINNSYSYSLYLTNYNFSSDIREKFLCEIENGQINFEGKSLQERRAEFTLKEIKAEAKKAVKDAEKLRKSYEKYLAMQGAIKAEYKTIIANFLPSTNSGYLEDKYRFF